MGNSYKQNLANWRNNAIKTFSANDEKVILTSPKFSSISSTTARLGVTNEGVLVITWLH